MLHFIYGVMGSSKSAQALITRYNYIQNGFHVTMLKPSLDTRSKQVKSRIGLKAHCQTFSPTDNLWTMPLDDGVDDIHKVVVIVDEAQFCTAAQIDQLKAISEHFEVYCYGLKTDFQTHLFEGSKRLFEIADTLERIPAICKCGKQADVNARFDNGKIVTDGNIIQIGDTEYVPMCYNCYKEIIEKEQEERNSNE